MPTTQCTRTGSRTWCRPLRIPGSASSRRRRITATAERSLLHHALNGEYAGFFDIGMVERNEANAIIVHGTMCLIRRTALAAAGSWSSDTIVEDSDLGLTILELGWRALYTNRRYGFGLLPDTFEAYKKQRHRWAYGGVQLIKKHWRRFLPGASPSRRSSGATTRSAGSTGWAPRASASPWRS